MPAPRDIDALVIDWLYDELSDSQAKELEAYMAAHPASRAEFEGLRRTREMLRDLPVAEPPPAVTARLLHEAARLAPKSAREGQGWFASFVGWFQPLIAHPAMAAVACLVLVGGVAGTLYLRGQHKVATPTVSSRAPAPEAADRLAAAPAAEAPPVITKEGGEESGDGFNDGSRVARVLEDSEGEAAAAKDPTAAAVGKLAAGEDNDESPADRLGRSGDGSYGDNAATREQRQEPQQEVKKGPLGKNFPNTDTTVNATSGADLRLSEDDYGDAEGRDFAKAPSPARSTASKGDSAGALGGKDTGTSTGTSTGKKSKSSAPPPPPGSKGGGGTAQPSGGVAVTTAEPVLANENRPQVAKPSLDLDGRSEVSANSKPSYRPEPVAPAEPSAGPSKTEDKKANKQALSAKDLAWAKTQQAELLRLLRAKKCRDAARIANDILDRTPDYYLQTVATSKDLKACSWYVSDERQKRAAERAKSRSKRAAPPADQADYSTESAE